jgi:hypothetical protein
MIYIDKSYCPEFTLCLLSPNSERDLIIIPCAVKSSFKTGSQISLSVHINHSLPYLFWQKTVFHASNSELNSFWIWNEMKSIWKSRNLVCNIAQGKGFLTGWRAACLYREVPYRCRIWSCSGTTCIGKWGLVLRISKIYKSPPPRPHIAWKVAWSKTIWGDLSTTTFTYRIHLNISLLYLCTYSPQVNQL